MTKLRGVAVLTLLLLATMDGTEAARKKRALVPRKIGTVYSTYEQQEGGGFTVRRSVGSMHLSEVDPFLMLDHMGPTEYGPGEAVGAPDHPHRGFETVTYVLSGGFHHLDNQGNEGRLKDGWVQWMTAGSGIVHSEMPDDDLLENGGVMEGFQLWVNLPAREKMIPPRYQDTPPEKIPKVRSPDGQALVTVIAGSVLDTWAVIETHTPMLFLDIIVVEGGSFSVPVPEEFAGFVYVFRGKGKFGPKKESVATGQYFALGEGEELYMESDISEDYEPLRLLLLAGLPIEEPVARHGPFVMNTRDEIQQALRDYNNGVGGFGKPIPGAQQRRRKTEMARQLQDIASGRRRDIEF